MMLVVMVSFPKTEGSQKVFRFRSVRNVGVLIGLILLSMKAACSGEIPLLTDDKTPVARFVDTVII